MQYLTFRYFTFFLLSFFFLSGLPAQPSANKGNPIVLSGKVMDAESQELMEYATVTLLSLPDSAVKTGTVTSDRGTFQLEAPQGRYAIKIAFLGYEDRYLPAFELTEQLQYYKVGTVYLNIATKTLDEVQITAEKSQMQFALDKRIFNVGQDLNRVGGNAADVLDNIPSVTVDVDGNVQLRGSSNVRILVNGRPSGLTGISSTQALQNFPANMIERVEIITNPSARYEAEGNAGIINIVLKKDRRQGWNGIFDVSTGWPHNHNASVNLNHRREKVNFFVNYSVRYRKSPGGGVTSRELYRPDSLSGEMLTYRLNQDQRFVRGGLSNSLRFGTDFYINPQNTLTASLVYRLGNDLNTGFVEYLDFAPFEQLTGITLRNTEEVEIEKNLDYNLQYRKSFDQKDRVLTADVIYSSGLESESMDAENQDFNPEFIPLGNPNLQQRINNTETQRNLILQSDYVHPLGADGKFEAGVRAGIRHITNDFLTEEYDYPNSKWMTLSEVSNLFEYDEKIYAAYGILGDKVEQFSYQVGLRAEYTDITTHLKETDEKYEKRYQNLFPSAHLTYEFADDISLQIGYSRRVRRPRFWDLNPFFTFINPFNIRSGNPNLDPEFTHALDFNYLKYWDKASFSGGAYFRHTDGVIQRISRVDEAGVTRSMPENIAQRQDIGLEFAGSYDALDWLRVNASTNFYRGSLQDSVLTGSESRDFFSWTMRSNVQVRLKGDWEGQLQMNFRGAEKRVLGSRKAMFYSSLGINKDVLDNKATISFRLNDIFNTQLYRFDSFGEDFFLEGDYRWRPRSVTLGLTYRLNQKKQGRGGRGGGRDFGGGDMGM
jgi:ferric enterobactin receptor